MEDEFLCEDGTDASWYGIDEEDDRTDTSWCGIDEEDDRTDTSSYGLHEEDNVTLAELNMANEGAERPSLARSSFKFTYTSGSDCITHPFVTYAFAHWLDHVRDVEIARPELVQDVLTFLTDLRFDQIHSKCLLDFVSRHSLYYIPLSCGPIALLLCHGLVHTIRRLGDTRPHLLEELDSNISDYSSFLMLAVFSANLTMAESLLNLGVDCDKVTSKHHIAGDPISALWLAIEYGHDEMFTLLVRAGARLELPSGHFGDLLIFQMAFNNQSSMLSQVLDRMNVNARSHDGSTAMHYTAQACSLAIVRTLLETGCDPNVANCLGLTPLEIAFTLQDPDVVGALLQGGASTGKLHHWKDLSWATEKPWFPLFKFRTQDYHPIPCEGTHDVGAFAHFGVPSFNTAFTDLLQLLDYSKHYSHSVKKSLILRNWQPQDDSDPYLKAVIEDKLCKVVFMIRSLDQGMSIGVQ